MEINRLIIDYLKHLIFLKCHFLAIYSTFYPGVRYLREQSFNIQIFSITDYRNISCQIPIINIAIP